MPLEITQAQVNCLAIPWLGLFKFVASDAATADDRLPRGENDTKVSRQSSYPCLLDASKAF